MVKLRKLAPRIPPCVKVPFVVWGCQGGCTKWWLYEVSGGGVEISPNVRKSAELRASEISKVKEESKWMCRGSPQAVQNVAVQGHVGSDSSPLGSTLVQLLLSIAFTCSCAAARPLPTLLRHVVVLSGSYPTYPCDGLLVRLALWT